MIYLLAILLYLAIGVWLLLRDLSNPNFEQALKLAREEFGISKEELDRHLPFIKIAVVLTWPLSLLLVFIGGKK